MNETGSTGQASRRSLSLNEPERSTKIMPFAVVALLATALPSPSPAPPSRRLHPISSASAPTPATSARPSAMTLNPGSPSNPNVSGAVVGTATTTPQAGGPSAAMQGIVATPAK